MKFVNLLLMISLLAIGLVGCTTTPEAIEPPLDAFEPPASIKKPRSERSSRARPAAPPKIELNLDYEGLSRSMGMDPPRESLGLKEKRFNTCTAGYGYSSSQDCRQNYFTVVNFRLLCRDSEGTVSVTINPEDLRPLSGRNISWAMNGNTGSFRLDNQGYGQIKTTSESSLQTERLKITADNDFLYMRAGQVNRIVTPSNWCN